MNTKGNLGTKDIIEIVISSLKSIISERDKDKEIPIENIDESTFLFGSGSFIDSLTLVSLIVDVEQKLCEDYGIPIIIADERAMSQEKSPFRNIGTLANYIQFLLSEREPNA